MSKEYDFDLFVIGAGSGGVRAGRMAAAKGKKVAIAEVSDLGGTCVNVGCVPKKLFVYASQFPELFHASQGYGWNIQKSQSFNWETLRDNKTQEIKRLNGIYQNLLSNSG
ncbi:MAG: FAD-dependent oxidoreductase, partial [Porticoccaceae bacterium]